MRVLTYIETAVRVRVPYMDSEGEVLTTIVRVPLDYTEDRVRLMLHDAIGCSDIVDDYKPSMYLHLSKDAKAVRYKFGAAGWEIVLSEWPEEVKKKGGTGVVEVTLPAGVSRISFDILLLLTLNRSF